MALDFLRRALGWMAGEAAPLASTAPEVYRLFLLQPEIVFAARINASAFSYPLSEVAFDTVTTGAFGDIEVGQTIFFGSSAGAFDKGAQRVRQAATSTVLYFGRSSRGTRPGEVDLADNLYIQVINLREVWARPPFISASGVVSKDPGLPVEWRTTTPPPVANTGPGYARTIDPDTGLITVALPPTANTSFATTDGATITTYLWDVADGTIVTGTSASSTIVATFPAGFRYVSLTVTDSEGHTHTAYCPVFARDPDDDPCIPFEFEQHSIGVDGQRVSVRVLADIPATTFPPGTLALIWREPADVFDRTHMIIIGWLGDIPAQIEAQRTGTLRDVTLELLDVAGRLERTNAFSQAVEDDSLRDTDDFPAISWFHFVDLTMDKYLHYLLTWHSTALSLADFTWSDTGSTYAVTGLESGGGSLWEQVASQAEKMRPDWRLTCNRRGQIRVLPDPMVRDTGDRTATVQATLTAADWSDLRYTHKRHPRMYWLRGGAVVAGNTLPIAVVFSVAPGDAPGQGGAEQSQNEGLVASQAVLNATEGHRYARINAAQSDFRLALAAGDDLDIEPADMTWVELTLPAALAAQRGLSFTESRGLPKELSIRYNHAREGLTKTVELTWERETTGTPAVTYTPPVGDVPGDDDTWPGDYTAPPPGDVVEPIPVPPLPLYEGQNVVALIDTIGQLFRTSNFQNASPTWDRKTLSGISGSNEVHSFVVDPFSPLYRGLGSTVNGFVATRDNIYKVNDIFGATPTLTTLVTFADSANPSLDRFRSIQASFGRFFPTEADNPWLVCVSHYGGLSGHNGTWATFSTDGGATWSTEAQITAFRDTFTTEFRQPPIGLYLSPRTPGLAYTAAYTASADPPTADGYVSTNWGATWAAISNPNILPNDGLAGDLHAPWEGNPSENIVYHGAWEKADPLVYRAVRVNGAAATDISPSYDSHVWGLNRFSFGIRTYDGDRRYVALAGIANDASDTEDDDVFGAFVSNNYGDTWTNIVDTTIKTDAHPERIAFAADTEQVLFLIGSERYVRYSIDFGANILDKTGNLLGLTGSIVDLLGIVGGEAPP